MPRVLSAPAFRAMFAQETAEVFLICVTLTHNDIEPMRFVYNNRPIDRYVDGDTHTFHPAVFEISLPEEAPDRIPTVNLSIDNVDRAITDAVRTMVGRANLRLEVVLASSPNVVEAGPFDFAVLSCTYDADRVDAVLGFDDDLFNTAFPKDVYTPYNSPGLFK